MLDSDKKREYDDFRKYGSTGGFKFSNGFSEDFDPFSMFRKFFEDDEDGDDIFSSRNIFGKFKSPFHGGFSSGFDDDFGSFGSSNFVYSSNSTSSSGISKSIKKTTQIM